MSQVPFELGKKQQVDLSESGGGLLDLSGLAALNEAGKVYEEVRGLGFG